MRFYGRGVVWDPEKNKVLCRFVNGQYETTSKRTIDILTKAGYRAEKQGQEKKK